MVLGNNYIGSKGISKLDLRNGNSLCYNFERIINMTPTPIFSINKYKNEIWFGGDDMSIP